MDSNSFIPENFSIENWNSIEPYFQKLMKLPLDSMEEIEYFLECKSMLETAIDEDQAWRYIHVNIDTQNEEYKKAFEFFIDEIEPKVESWFNTIDRRIAESSAMLIFEKIHPIPARSLRKNIELFREENLPIYAELQKEEQEYGTIISGIEVIIDGKKYTLQQASELLQENDREFRARVYKDILSKRIEKAEILNELLSNMLRKRYKIAVNAGFRNFRDFQHQNLGRFDYSVEDIERFHSAILHEVNPIVDDIMMHRKSKLGVKNLKPWDLQVDIDGMPPLRPFKDSRILVQSAIECFNSINVDFGSIFSDLNQNGMLDLDSRFGKAPGGFNYPLHKSNRSFIFMNATGSMNDFEVLMHEGGHAFHANYSSHLPLLDYKNVPAELAELASMSMELISIEHWDTILKDKSDLKRAKRNILEDAISALQWIALIDKFQHWLYTNPEHSNHERNLAWTSFYKEFSSSEINWEGVEEAFVYTWQRQLHIFEMPFYYIEYAFAQLGAIAIWNNYRINPKDTIGKFISMMKLGYSKPLPELYKVAGIEFLSNQEYISNLMKSVREELRKLY